MYVNMFNETLFLIMLVEENVLPVLTFLLKRFVDWLRGLNCKGNG